MGDAADDELWERLQQYWTSPKVSHVTASVRLVPSDRDRRRPRPHLEGLWRTAALIVLCGNRSRGRRRRLAAVLPDRDRAAGLVLTVDPDHGIRYPLPGHPGSLGSRLGEDIEIECRCGVTHVIDGALLRSHLLGLRLSRRPATVDITEVERISAPD